jgi:predicted deacylase
MQIQNPSPLGGYFEPAVPLGQRIAAGEPIGSVCDVTGKRRVSIESKQSGIVVVLKTFCRVDKNDAVAVIVEVDRPLGGA